MSKIPQAFFALTVFVCTAYAASPSENELRLIERDATHAAFLLQTDPTRYAEFARAIRGDLKRRLESAEKNAKKTPLTPAVTAQLHNAATAIAFIEDQLSSDLVQEGGQASAQAVASGSISGRLVDSATGVGISNGGVQVFTLSGQYVRFAPTNSDGNYRVTRVPAGSYRVVSYNTGGYINKEYPSPVVVDWISETQGINFSLVPGARISGRVISEETGNPLTGWVDVYDGAGILTSTALIDATGNYLTRNGFESGNYFVVTNNYGGLLDQVYAGIDCDPCNPTTGTPVPVTSGATTSGIDFSLRHHGRISGTVRETATNLPIHYANVLVFDQAGTIRGSWYTDETGSFTIAPGSPGVYFATAAASSRFYLGELFSEMECEPDCDPTTGTTITTASGQVVGNVNFTLSNQASRIRGVVTEAVTGAPLQWTTVVAYNSEGSYVAQATTDALGRYDIFGNFNGDYYIAANRPPNYRTEVFDNVICDDPCNVLNGTPVHVEPGPTVAGIDFSLEPKGSIRGRVTDQVTGAPLTGTWPHYASVSIYDASGGFVTGSAVDMNGDFAANGLLTGSYFVVASAYEYVGETYDNVPCPYPCQPTSGTPVNVTIGIATTGIDFALIQGGMISGIIRDALTLDDVPAHITIYNSSGTPIVSKDVVGAYITPRLFATGTYYLKVSSGGHIDELYDDIPCEDSCTVTSGTPISVVVGATTANINVDLQPTVGRISGRVTNAATGQPVAGVRVEFYNSPTYPVASAITAADGTYIDRSFRLTPGQYWVRTRFTSGYVDELYNDQTCITRCPFIRGLQITVTAGTVTSAIDFALSQFGVSSVTPNHGSAAGQTEILIQGIGISAGVTVTLGGVPAAVQTVNSYSIRALTPAQAVGTVDVAVQHPNGLISTLQDGFRYEAPPPSSPYLVKDIDISPRSTLGMEPYPLVVAVGSLFFAQDTLEHGTELWKSDGTDVGTVLVKDLVPGPDSSYPSSLAVHGPSVYFVTGSYYGGHHELRRSDGTAAGTVLLVTTDGIGDPSGIPVIANLTSAGPYLYFTLQNSALGRELWRTDGTTEGTQIVKDLTPGAGSTTLFSFASLNGFVYFQACTPETGCELWKSDGTEAGTLIAFDLVPGPDYVYTYETAVRNGELYFASRNAVGDIGLYRSDGTQTGTTLLKVFRDGDYGLSFFHFTSWNGSVYFSANDGISGVELWKTDGSPAGTTRVADIHPGAGSSMPTELTVSGSHLFFAAWRPDVGQEIWRTDGTETGTILLKDMNPGSYSSEIRSIGAVGNTVVFDSRLWNGYGSVLWRSDGTPEGTVRFTSDVEPLMPNMLTLYNGSLYFGGVTRVGQRELWRTDGTTAGTVIVKTFPIRGDGTGSAVPRELTKVGSTLFFAAYERGLQGSSLYRSDGTAEGTQLVSPAPRSPHRLIRMGSAVYFTAHDDAHGRELWRSDGTPEGTALVADLRPGPESAFNDSQYEPRFIVSGQLLYGAAYLATGYSMVRTDGSAAGTFVIRNTWPTTPVDFDGTLYFADNGLYKTNGTVEGTIRINQQPINGLFAIGGRLFVVSGNTLWILNEEGNATSFLAAANPQEFAILNGTVFFTTQDALWKTDGTMTGTLRIATIGSTESAKRWLTSAAGKLFFLGSDPVFGVEVWVSDGTQAGTHLLKDIFEGTPMLEYFFPPRNLINVNGRLHFVAFDGKHNSYGSIWQSDGTSSGTILFNDWPDSATDFVQIGTRLFFTGDGIEGIELRATSIGPPVTISSIAPKSGPHAGGTAITIVGSNFMNGVETSFGAVPLRNPTYVSETQITGQTPLLQPGRLYDVTVRNGESATLPRAFLSDFLDVPQAHPLHNFVESVFRAGITAGCGSGSYCVNNSTTRAQMAIFLLRAIHGGNYVPPPATGTMFGDVPVTAFAAAWIEQLALEGISAGCGGGNFCPDSPVIRSQMAIFLLRAKHGASYTPPPETGIFEDVPVGSFGAAWIEQLYNEGITGGCSTDPLRFCPTSPVTRGQMAVFVTRTVNLP